MSKDKSVERILEIIKKLDKSINEEKFDFTQKDVNALKTMSPENRINFFKNLGKANISSIKANDEYDNFFNVTKPEYNFTGGNIFYGDINDLCTKVINEPDMNTFYSGFNNEYVAFKANRKNSSGVILTGKITDVTITDSKLNIRLIKTNIPLLFTTINDQFYFEFENTSDGCKLVRMEIKIFNSTWDKVIVGALAGVIRMNHLCNSVTTNVVSGGDKIEIFFR